MSETRHFKIHAAPTSSNSWIELDGKRIHNVVVVSVQCAVKEATRITLEMLNVDVEIDGIAEVTAIGDNERRYREGGAR